jgi:hypothetical protein
MTISPGIASYRALVREVVGPDGRSWRVARRWTRRRVRWRRTREQRDGDRHWWDVFDVLDVFDLADVHPALAVVGLVVVLVIVLGLGVVFVVPFLLALVDVLVIAAVLVVGAGARTLLGRPWEIEARTDGPPADERTWRVRGWRESDRGIEQVARGIERGKSNPAPDLAERAP